MTARREETEAEIHARIAKSRAEREAAVRNLNKFTVNGITVFDCSARDLASSSLDMAHALCVILDNSLRNEDENGDIQHRPVHPARAIEGIGTLISLAAFAAEAA